MNWLRRYRLKLFFLVMSSGLAAGVFVASVRAGNQDDKNHETILWVGAVLAVGVVLVAATEAALNEREKENARREAERAVTALAFAYQQTFWPLSQALGTLSQEYAAAYSGSAATLPAGLAGTQAAQSTSVIKTVLLAASVLTAERHPVSGLPTARCAFYRMTDPATHTFTLVDWAGRAFTPRPTVDGTLGSHFRHDILEPRDPYHVSKETGLVSKVDLSGKDYRSVIAVPVVAGSREFGVLAVDAPRDTDLKDVHVHLMKSLARFLGAALALA
ncbi:GAF domain-containing protein [Streptomyces sp. ME19-01-6]|uniref:GAF domain-containing protein n=1 Tax=Streptomyces sp. ME19-01-6 TaxID=3028686 RepID=UPI0029A7CF34|nr:GAF domain-containing protein [Streptomyces sp. ME19-01-6]MDX3231125.1 GAF domain-containing protein [Streptomyces sp. ME19-01-6]